MFKKYEGRGFIIYVEGPTGTDGRKRGTTPVSCRPTDFQDILSLILQGEKWIKQDESLVPAGAIMLYSRPSGGKKPFTIVVEQSDFIRTVYFESDPKSGKDPRESVD